MYDFNIRVYGLILNKNNEILVTDEFRFGQKMTKYVGGGLIYGEGTLECLQREILEEVNIVVQARDLVQFYTTDFFVSSSFHENVQVVGVYYYLKSEAFNAINLLKKPFDFELVEHGQGFRWARLSDFDLQNELSFKTDRVATKRLFELLA